MAHHFTPDPVAPLHQLLHRGGAKGVPGHEKRFLAQLLEMPGDLSDRGRLACAIHSDNEDHRRGTRHVDASIRLTEMVGGHFSQLREQIAGVLHAPLVCGPLQDLHDRHGGLHPDVGVDERLFDVLPQVFIEAVEEHRGKLLLQSSAALGEAVTQLAEPPLS